MLNQTIIFGTGSGGLEAYSQILKTNHSVLCFVDNDTKKRGLMLAGLPIKLPAEIEWSKIDGVFIATIYYREIFEQLHEKLAVPIEKIHILFSFGGILARELCLKEHLAQAEQLAIGSDRFVGLGEASAHLIRAEIAFFKQEWLSSSLFFDQAQSISQEDFSVSIYARFAQACRKAMRLDQAEEMIRKGLLIDPDYKWLYLEYAELEMAREKWFLAIEYFEKANGLFQGDLPINTYTRFAQACRKAMRLDQAEEMIRRGLLIDPDYKWLYLEYAELEMTRENWLSVIEYFEKANGLFQGDLPINTYARFAQACRKAMRLDQAEEMIRKGLLIDPDYKWLYLEYAELEMAREKWFLAIEHFKKVMKYSIEDLPDRFFVYFSRSYNESLFFHEAIKIIDLGLKRKPANIWFLNERASIEKKRAEWHDFMRQIEASLKNNVMSPGFENDEFREVVSTFVTLRKEPTHTLFKKLSQWDKFTDDQGHSHLVYKPYDHFVWGNDDWRTSESLREGDRILRKLDHDRKNVGYFFDILTMTGHHLEGSHILEIGCGDGLRSYIIANSGIGQICSIDPDIDDRVMMKSLQSYTAYEDINPDKILDKMTIQEKGIEDLEDEKQYDLIVSWYVFEHVMDPRKAFEKIAKALKPGGLAYFVVNPFFSISGGHMRGSYNIPFSHVILDDQSYRRFLGKYYSDKACEQYFQRHTKGLNRMTIEDFKGYANEVGLKSELFITTPSRQAKSVLTSECIALSRDRYPSLLLQDMLCNVITVLFTKPNHADV